VYLVFEEPSQGMPSAEIMIERLLHKPLEPLSPGPLFPSLAVSIIVREMIGGKTSKKEVLKRNFLEFVSNTYRGTMDEEYTKTMSKYFASMFTWLTKEGVLETTAERVKVNKEARMAVLAGLDPIDYIQTKDVLSKLKETEVESTFIELLLSFRLPQSIRPRTFVPSKSELAIMHLSTPEDWYMNLVPERREIKRTVLERWLDEQEVASIINETREMARGISLDEGDLDSLLGICSAAAGNLSSFYKAKKNKELADRFHVLSRQLQYGVHQDLADSDLLDLRFIEGDNSQSSRLSRDTARKLYENGYQSISDIVRKDIDASKKGLARDRFAKNCGLENEQAKEVYKAAMMHIRSKIREQDDEEEEND